MSISVVKFENFESEFQSSLIGCFVLIDRWNSWNYFACNINETVIKETGKAFFCLIASNKKLLTCFIPSF